LETARRGEEEYFRRRGEEEYFRRRSEDVYRIPGGGREEERLYLQRKGRV